MRAFFHPDQLLHVPRTYLSRGAMREPQEIPERANRILRALKALSFDIRTPQDYGLAPLQAVHTSAYLTYALCRPPGHHARKDSAGGFCYMNNTAIAAQVLRSKYKKVAVLDTDVHHGQGTQDVFYDRSDVLTVSVHANPENFYPVVVGFKDETGNGDGVGYNHNFPVPHGSSESVYFDYVDCALDVVREFAPDALVFAHGFDIYIEDPQSRVGVSAEGFVRLGERIASLNLPTVIVQEGGYHLPTLDSNARRFGIYIVR